MKFRTKYERNRVISPHGGKSITDPQYLAECSIDGLIKRYGVMPQPVPPSFGTSADVSTLGDFAEVMQRVVDARESFMEMPSDLRARFGHSPEAFYSWLSDKNNTEEAIRLGLLVAKAPEKDETLEVLERIAANTSPEAKQS